MVVLAAVCLSGCGRKGPLDLPPSAATPPAPAASSANPSATPSPAPASPQETAAKGGFDSHGNPVAPPGEKKSFILDPLLQ